MALLNILNTRKLKMKTNPDESISLVRYDISQPDMVQYDGLTKREYFAALAMQGLISINNWSDDRIAQKSVEMSDKLIEALNKE